MRWLKKLRSALHAEMHRPLAAALALSSFVAPAASSSAKRQQKIANATLFVNEAHAYAASGGAGGACNEEAYQHVEQMALLLSTDLMATSRHYKQHSWGGIFAQGGGGGGESNKFSYAQVKSRFIFDRVCPKQKQIVQACEVGFMAGHTAMLFAEAAPQAKVLSFDLGSVALVPWLSKQNVRLKDAYGDRWMGVVKGSSLVTVPRWLKEHPGFKCDVVFVDGGKTTDIRASDFENFAKMSHPRTLVFFDEVTRQECVNGTASEADCRFDSQGKKISDATTAKTAAGAGKASRNGILKVRQCKWPPGWEGLDGICAARFTAAATGASKA